MKNPSQILPVFMCIIFFWLVSAGIKKPALAIQDPTDNPQMIKKGLMFFKQGNLDASEKVFSKLLNTNQKSLISKEMLAIIAYRNNDFKRAFTFAEKSLKQNRRSAKAHLVMAGVFRQRGNMLAAKDHLNKAKRFVSAKEKEILAVYLSDENKRVIKDLAEMPVDKGKKTYQLEAAGDKPLIAVFAFEDDADEETGIGANVSEMLITGLIQTEKFQVVERSQLDKILEEQALGQSGFLDQETAAQVGTLIGVDAVVVGNVGLLKTQIEIDGRLVQPENGKVLSAGSVTVQNESQLRVAANKLAAQFASESEKITLSDEQVEK